MKLTEHFMLEEFIVSSNHPELNEVNAKYADKFVDRLTKLAETLEIIRKELGPIHITSGYRCDELNSKVGGVTSSQHRYGEAADCQFNVDIFKAFDVCKRLIKDGKLTVRQIILEYKRGTRWIHIGIVNGDGKINELLAYDGVKYMGVV